MKIFELQAMDAVRPAKSLDQVSAIQCLMSLQNCSACLWHCHGQDWTPDSASLWASAAKLYNTNGRSDCQYCTQWQ